MEIRIFDDNRDINDFLELFNTSFGRLMSRDYFDWKYIDNPFRIDKITIIVAKEGNKLIGARPFMATRLVIDGETVGALQPCDTMVHPEFRLKGVFTLMNRVAIEEFQRTNYKIFYNFPNKYSFQGYLKCGWETINKTTWHWLVLNSNKVFNTVLDNYALQKAGALLIPLFRLKFRLPKLGSQNITVVPTSDLRVLGKVFNEWKGKSSETIHTARDEKYLNWRFRLHPENEYLFIVAQIEDETKGYFIVNIGEFTGMKRGTISDYLVLNNDPDIFKSLLAYSLNLFKERNCDVADTWAFTQKWVEEILEACGFISSRNIFIKHRFSNQYLVGRPINKQAFPYHLPYMKWHITPSDADFF